ncbi:MAG: acyltransferase family protein [Terriglobales bacterium]
MQTGRPSVAHYVLDSLPEKGSVPASKSGTGLNRAFGWILKHATRETSSGRFIPEIDGLRFFAIGMVILFHVNGYLLAKSSLAGYAAAPHTDWLSQTAFVGFHGVELFFVISGFILGFPSLRTTFGEAREWT